MIIDHGLSLDGGTDETARLRTLANKEIYMINNVLNMRDLTLLSMVAELAEHNRKVRWIDPNDQEHAGMARSIGDHQGNFLGRDQDVREGFLRITSVTGFEFFIPVTNVMAMFADGMIGIDH